MVEIQDNPVAVAYRRRRWRFVGIVLAMLLLLAGFFYWRYFAPIPVDYASDVDHFKYGSIGSDSYDGIPLRIWKVLPALFPEYMPDEGAGYLSTPESKRTYLDGYRQFGFLVEPGRPLPIGFSQRRVYVDRVGLNCAVCHTSTICVDDASIANSIYGYEPTYVDARNTSLESRRIKRAVVLGMPANTVDLEAYFTFLFRSAEDPRFNAATLMAAMRAMTEKNGAEESRIGLIEGFFLRRAIPRLRETLLARRRQLAYIALLTNSEEYGGSPRFGPGRVDTFSPYKSIQFGFPPDGTFGIADYPSIWNQRPREGMDLHWDGNNKSVFERNISASLGAGATPVAIDMHRMLRTAKWIGSPPPPNPDFGGPERADTANNDDDSPPLPRKGEMPIPNYPFPIDSVRAAAGAVLFKQHCAQCHEWGSAGVGDVVKIADIATDPARLDSYTEALQASQNLLGANTWWRFRHFKKTGGYASMPLDGIWARAPYLHNGSVPTLYDLFNKPCDATDLALLGITADTNLRELAEQPDAVAAMISKARSLGLRPPVFFRGDDMYDEKFGGFRCDQNRAEDGRRLFLYSTITMRDGKLEPLLGNGHGGHYGAPATNAGSYGTHLSTKDKLALVEYQKTIGGRERGGAR